MLTHSELKVRLRYDAKTGNFYWIKPPKRSPVKVGDIAGSVHTKGYIQITIGGARYLAHRLAWFFEYGMWPSNQIDHINGNRSDNSIVNLRDVSNAENGRNAKRFVTNRSGVTGVHKAARSGKWIAQIRFAGKQREIGRFSRFTDAVSARKDAEVKLGFHPNHGRN